MKTVKKIMALSTGAVMVGATVLSASAAADLTNYPAPFVKDGKFNGLIVVGDSANAADVLGSVDIATNLQFAAKVKKTVQSTSAASVSVSGEAWRVGTSAKKFEISEKGTGVNETFRDITTFITDDELPTILADETFRNSRGDFDYHQYLYFDNVNSPNNNPVSRSVVFDKSTNDANRNEIGDFLYVKSRDQIARYSLEFTSSAESDLTTAAGTTDSAGTFLWSFEGKDIKILGKTYAIVKARTSSGGVKLTLMGGAAKDTLSEGESKTYTVGGKDYDVSLDFVGSTTAKFTVNSELTDSLVEGDTYTLSDKSLIGVKDILVQDYSGGVRSVEFYVGANKIELEDTDITDGLSSTQLKVGTSTVDDTSVIITGTNDTTNKLYKINTIQLNVTADTNIYVPAGGRLSEQLREPGALLGAWDITYGGMEVVKTNPIKLSPSSDQYYLEFSDGNGDRVSLPIVYTDSNNNLKFGDSNYDTILDENETINVDDYFVLSDESQNPGARATYVFQYTRASRNSTTGTKGIVFKNMGSAGIEEKTLTVPYSETGIGTSGAVIATIVVGGASYNVWAASAATSDDFNIRIDLDADGSLVGSAPTSGGHFSNLMNITTKSGAQIMIWPGDPAQVNATWNTSVNPNSGVIVSVQTVDSDDFDSKQPTKLEYNITASGGELRASQRTDALSNAFTYQNPQGDSTIKYVYTSMGAKVTFESPTSDPQTVTIDYPTVQSLPLVYITAPGAEISAGEASEAGQIVYYETAPISVGTAKLAGEVANIAAQNTIIVGGPCANAAAAEVMGMPEPCGKDFSIGKAMIKLYEQTNGNVAMLVAGYEAADTRRAARVIANYAQWQDSGKLKGTAVEVSGTSFTDISVAAPAPKVVAPVVPAETPAETPAATPTE